MPFKRKIILLFVLIGCFSMKMNAQINPAQVRQFVDLELKHYPEATLADLYKNYFQDAYGPGHLLNDTARAGKYMDWELAQTDYSDTTLVQPLGINHDFYRINLLLVKNGTISRDELLKAMVESAVLARKPSLEAWQKEWNEVAAIIQQYKPDLPDFSEDLNLINQNISAGKVMSHHSSHFEETYRPHYRIIHKSMVEKWERSGLEFKNPK